MDWNNSVEEQAAPPAEPPPAAVNAVPPLRAEDYWQYLDGMDLSDAEKTAVLQTLWAMMVGFVDLGFNADPVEHILPALVQGVLDDDRNGLEQKAASRFNSAANHNKAGEGSP